MKFFKGIMLVYCMTIASKSFAQEPDGLLQLYIFPKPETIMINDSVLKFGNKIKLAPGQHQIRVWAPSYELLDTTITITAGENFDFFYQMQHHTEYYAYESRYKEYKKHRTLRFNLPFLTTTALLGTSIYTYVEAAAAYDEVGIALEEYKFATIDLDKKYNAYEDSSNKYRTKRAYFYTSAGLTAISAYFLYKGIKWKKENPAEEYIPGKNPLTFHNIYILPSPAMNGGYSLGVVFNFKH